MPHDMNGGEPARASAAFATLAPVKIFDDHAIKGAVDHALSLPRPLDAELTFYECKYEVGESSHVIRRKFCEAGWSLDGRIDRWIGRLDYLPQPEKERRRKARLLRTTLSGFGFARPVRWNRVRNILRNQHYNLEIMQASLAWARGRQLKPGERIRVLTLPLAAADTKDMQLFHLSIENVDGRYRICDVPVAPGTMLEPTQEILVGMPYPEEVIS